MIHILKTWPEFYCYIVSSEKTFEIRKNDRNFEHGDVLALREFDPGSQEYSGEFEIRRVTYLTDFGMSPGYVCMAIKQWSPWNLEEMVAVAAMVAE